MKTHMLKCLPIIAMILGSMQTTRAQENQQTISSEVNPPFFQVHRVLENGLLD